MKANTLKVVILTIMFAVSAALYADAGRQQCDALTKKGVQCKNLALPGTIYCRVHSDLGVGGVPPAPVHSKCQFVSKKSGRCGVDAVSRGIYCPWHDSPSHREQD